MQSSLLDTVKLVSAKDVRPVNHEVNVNYGLVDSWIPRILKMYKYAFQMVVSRN